jgi:hypothetical protein
MLGQRADPDRDFGKHKVCGRTYLYPRARRCVRPIGSRVRLPHAGSQSNTHPLSLCPTFHSSTPRYVFVPQWLGTIHIWFTLGPAVRACSRVRVRNLCPVPCVCALIHLSASFPTHLCLPRSRPNHGAYVSDRAYN